MFTLIKGKTKNIYLPVTPSLALPARSLVTMSGGLLVAATAATPKIDIFGVLVGAITATDVDFAVSRRVAVEVPTQTNAVYEFDTTGLVAADIGVDVDLTNNVSVNRAATAIGCVRVVSRISATRGRGHIAINGAF